MKKKLKSVFAAVFVLFTIGLAAQSTPGKAAFFVETDPSTFAFGGYAAHFRFKPANSEHLLVGAGTYALDFPSVLVDMNSKNKGKGWDVRIKSAYSVFGEYYFNEAGNKWYTGLQAGVQNFSLKNDQTVGKSSGYRNLLLMPSVGYTWYPFRFPLYVKPWLGIGYTTKISGENSLESLVYDVAPIVPFFTLHAGYRF